jgi:diguanylate cyclase (GGDEF)-like protein
VPPLRLTKHLSEDWTAVLGRVDFAFQPIVNIHTGHCFGYEALLRCQDEARFPTPPRFFDACHAADILVDVEVLLCEKIIEKFRGLPHSDRVKLFVNLDNRSLARGFPVERIGPMLVEAGLPAATITLEISERHPLGSPAKAAGLLRQLRQSNLRLAMDDFGTGYSGLQMLYLAEPNLIKIDRFFINNIPSDPRKKVFVSKVVDIAHLLGAFVIAEGVETEQEYLTCRDIGCDMVQGFLVQKPTRDLADLRQHYDHIGQLAQQDRRRHDTDQRIIAEQVEAVEPLAIATDMNRVFERIRSDPSATFVPVVDHNHEPMGIVRESDLKEYAYSPFGRDLISNRAFGKTLHHFLRSCPLADVNATAEDILQTFSTAGATSPEGIIMVRDMRYVGFLSAHSLLRVINEKNLQAARDENPLTKLPGNNLIHQYVSRALAEIDQGYVFAYLDFDNFKPFNDTYGFRLGDRAILLFAELLAKDRRDDTFIGHIGGDDFFVGYRSEAYDQSVDRVATLIRTFASDVSSFYDEPTRRAGWMTGQDRDGNTRRFPLLGVSAAVVMLPPGRDSASPEDVGVLIAELKKASKKAEEHMAVAALVSGNVTTM